MKLYAFLDLLPDALLGTAVRRVERVVAAEGAAAGAYRAVAVRTAEARVDAYLLHASAELAREIRVVAVKPPVIAPRVHFS